MAELPTVAEAGLPGYKFDSWIGLFGSAAMPKVEQDRINNAVQKALADPAVIERFKNLGVEMTTASPDEFQQILRADWDNAALILKSSGAKVE